MKKKDYVAIIQRIRKQNGKLFVYANVYGDVPEENDSIYLGGEEGHFFANEIVEVEKIHSFVNGIRARLVLREEYDIKKGRVIAHRNRDFARICDIPQKNIPLRAWIAEVNHVEGDEPIDPYVMHQFEKCLFEAIFITQIVREKESTKLPLVTIEEGEYCVGFTDYEELSYWNKHHPIENQEVGFFSLIELFEKEEEPSYGLVINPDNPLKRVYFDKEVLAMFLKEHSLR